METSKTIIEILSGCGLDKGSIAKEFNDFTEKFEGTDDDYFDDLPLIIGLELAAILESEFKENDYSFQDLKSNAKAFAELNFDFLEGRFNFHKQAKRTTNSGGVWY